MLKKSETEGVSLSTFGVRLEQQPLQPIQLKICHLNPLEKRIGTRIALTSSACLRLAETRFKKGMMSMENCAIYQSWKPCTQKNVYDNNQKYEKRLASKLSIDFD